MGGEHGVENSLKVLELLAEGGNVAEDMAQGSGSFLDKAKHLAKLTDELWALTGVSWGELAKELKELDGEDRQKLYDGFKVKFNLDNDVVEALVEDGVFLVSDYASLAKRTVAFAKRIKAAASTPDEAA